MFYAEVEGIDQNHDGHSFTFSFSDSYITSSFSYYSDSLSFSSSVSTSWGCDCESGNNDDNSKSDDSYYYYYSYSSADDDPNHPTSEPTLYPTVMHQPSSLTLTPILRATSFPTIYHGNETLSIPPVANNVKAEAPTTKPTSLSTYSQTEVDKSEPPQLAAETSLMPSQIPTEFNPVVTSSPYSQPSFPPTSSSSQVTNPPTVALTLAPRITLRFECQFIITNLTDPFNNDKDLPIIASTTAMVLNLTTLDIINTEWKPVRRFSAYSEYGIERNDNSNNSNNDKVIETISAAQEISVPLQSVDDANLIYTELSSALEEAVIRSGFYTLTMRRNAVAVHSAALDYATTIDVKVGPPSLYPKINNSRTPSSLSTSEWIALMVGILVILILLCITCIVTCFDCKDGEVEEEEQMKNTHLTDAPIDIEEFKETAPQ